MTQPDTPSAITQQVLMINVAIEWVGTTEGHCTHCGRPANGGPLAHINIYNLPGDTEMLGIIMHDEMTDTGERSNQWYFKAMGEQLEGVFTVAHRWPLCWQCVGTFLHMLTDQKEAALITLKRALDGTQDANGRHTKPWTTVVFLGGERDKTQEWGYIMAHMPHPLENVPLSSLLQEGMRRNIEDDFDLKVSEV